MEVGHLTQADLTPGDLWAAYEAFLVEATRLRSIYTSVSLLIGVETDYITDLDMEGLERLLLAHPEIDYIVGSVHHVNGVSIDFDRDTWVRAVDTAARGQVGTTCARVDGVVQLVPRASGPDPKLDDIVTFLNAYLDAQLRMLQRVKPEVVGHFDLCLLWTKDVRLSEFEDVWAKVRRNVEFAAGYGALFEANAAAIRKGWETSYPSRDVLRLIRESGGRICLSDDSHGVALVGLNYPRMRDYLVQEGVDTVWCLVPASQRTERDEDVGDRAKVVARPVPNWAQDPFWQAK